MEALYKFVITIVLGIGVLATSVGIVTDVLFADTPSAGSNPF